MLSKRIIPCLDVRDGRVVKGINFKQLRDMGDPVKMARRYYEEGADELVFLDVTATIEKRQVLLELVRAVSEQIFIPFTIGGGIRSIEDIKMILDAGADKISINSQAVHTPDLIELASKTFGSQCVVVAIDAKRDGDGSWEIYINGGRAPTGIDAIEWAKKMENLGAGELLVTSMDKDGTKSGYDMELYNSICDAVNIPVIASGGGGSYQSFSDVFEQSNVDAALAASIFHEQDKSVGDLKRFLQSKEVYVRL